MYWSCASSQGTSDEPLPNIDVNQGLRSGWDGLNGKLIEIYNSHLWFRTTPSNMQFVNIMLKTCNSSRSSWTSCELTVIPFGTFKPDHVWRRVVELRRVVDESNQTISWSLRLWPDLRSRMFEDHDESESIDMIVWSRTNIELCRRYLMAMVSQQTHCITVMYTSSHTIVPVSRRPALSTTFKLHYYSRLQKDLSLTFIILAAYQSITQTHDTATVDFLRSINFFHANSSHLQLANEEHRCIDCARAQIQLSCEWALNLDQSGKASRLHLRL